MAGLYIDDGGNPVLRPSFCMFLDALGFNDIIEQATQNGNADALLKEFFNALAGSTSGWTALSSSWEYKCFTDNVVFGCPADRDLKDNEGEFGSIFTTAGFHQLEMALAGFFVRGGMSYGPLHMSPDIVFGQACLDAYHLESKQAQHPRTVLNQDVMNEVYNHLRFYAYVAASPHDEGIFVDEDGHFFLNYLDCLIDADEVSISGFERHRDLITTKLQEILDPKIVPKYQWLARYHNHVIDRQVAPILEHYGDNPEPLKVAGHAAQACKSLSEFMKGDSDLSKRFEGRLP